LPCTAAAGVRFATLSNLSHQSTAAAVMQHLMIQPPCSADVQLYLLQHSHNSVAGHVCDGCAHRVAGLWDDHLSQLQDASRNKAWHSAGIAVMLHLVSKKHHTAAETCWKQRPLQHWATCRCMNQVLSCDTQSNCLADFRTTASYCCCSCCCSCHQGLTEDKGSSQGALTPALVKSTAAGSPPIVGSFDAGTDVSGMPHGIPTVIIVPTGNPSGQG
jgi:hypothetical protein